MNFERDKFLTEAMGECWHDWYIDCDDYTNYTCKICNLQSLNKNNNDFSTWEGFGKLWEWTQKQEWIENFEYNICQGDLGWYYKTNINPDKFASVVYEYLKV